MSEHPEKILRDAVEMYKSRVSVALEENKSKCRNTGMFVVMEERTRIVPDMKVMCLDREQVMQRVTLSHPTVAGTLAMFERTGDQGSVVFGVIFADGGAMSTVLQVHDADRDRRGA